MDFNKFNKLRDKLDTSNFELNFKALSNTLFYFSFLGNIFLVLFSYFFLTNITSNIPKLFPGQDIFFSIFVFLFMTGYELFKRFAFEQLTLSIAKYRKITTNILIGIITCLTLVAGSFYLSLNGTHRLINNTDDVKTVLQNKESNDIISLKNTYNARIGLKESQIKAIIDNDDDRVLNKSQRKVISVLEQDIKSYETELYSKLKEIDNKINTTLNKKQTQVNEDDLAFKLVVFFLEFIILMGVAFKSYYEWNTYLEMKDTLATPVFKKLENNLKLLKLYYQNGRKNAQDVVIPYNKLYTLCNTSMLNISPKDIKEFITLCNELEITTGNKRRKIYNIQYNKAKELIENYKI
jgi:hypothetical protein